MTASDDLAELAAKVPEVADARKASDRCGIIAGPRLERLLAALAERDRQREEEVKRLEQKVKRWEEWHSRMAEEYANNRKRAEDAEAEMARQKRGDLPADLDPKVAADFNDFWREIVAPDGVLDIGQVARELYDFHVCMREVAVVYDGITEGRLSKPNTLAVHVLSASDEREERERQEAEEKLRWMLRYQTASVVKASGWYRPEEAVTETPQEHLDRQVDERLADLERRWKAQHA